MSLVLGVDPGWASCGLAVNVNGVIETKTSFEPRAQVAEKSDSFVGPLLFISAFTETITRRIADFDHVYLERFVAYKGVQSTASEDILMFIGALKCFFEFKGIKVHMTRAIDWKPKICKYLVRTQSFNNPYPSFDKKYSILAASLLSGQKFETDHEADAVCLSYLGMVDEFNERRLKK